MFFNKDGTVYRRTYDSNRVSSRSSHTSITCKVSPFTGDKTGIAGGDDFEIFNLYTRTQTLQIGDKIVIESIAYIIIERLEHDGMMTTYARYIVKRSQGD